MSEATDKALIDYLNAATAKRSRGPLGDVATANSRKMGKTDEADWRNTFGAKTNPNSIPLAANVPPITNTDGIFPGSAPRVAVQPKAAPAPFTADMLTGNKGVDDAASKAAFAANLDFYANPTGVPAAPPSLNFTSPVAPAQTAAVPDVPAAPRFPVAALPRPGLNTQAPMTIPQPALPDVGNAPYQMPALPQLGIDPADLAKLTSQPPPSSQMFGPPFTKSAPVAPALPVAAAGPKSVTGDKEKRALKFAAKGTASVFSSIFDPANWVPGYNAL